MFTNAGRSNKNEWFVLKWSWVEWMEVLFGINKNIIRLVKQNRANEVVKNFSDLGMLHLILSMG